LQAWLKVRYQEKLQQPLQIEQEIKWQIALLCEEVLAQLRSHSGTATRALNAARENVLQFKKTANRYELQQAIQNLDPILQEPVLSLLPFGYLFSYSSETKQMTTHVMNQLRAIQAYLQNDMSQAASYFSQAKDDLRLGLMELILKQYTNALQSWERFIHSHSRDKVLSGHASRYLFFTMNYKDTLLIGENSALQVSPLNEVSQIQLKVLDSLCTK
jgi:hypothetical protein